jgi:hypothetical protein
VIEAHSLEDGGISAVSEATELSHNTIASGQEREVYGRSNFRGVFELGYPLELRILESNYHD